MKFYLQWNLVNWITVILMAFAGMIVLGFIASGIRQVAGNSTASAASNDD